MTKVDMIRAAAEAAGVEVIDLPLVESDPADLLGLPVAGDLSDSDSMTPIPVEEANHTLELLGLKPTAGRPLTLREFALIVKHDTLHQIFAVTKGE